MSIGTRGASPDKRLDLPEGGQIGPIDPHPEINLEITSGGPIGTRTTPGGPSKHLDLCGELHITTNKSVGITPKGWYPNNILDLETEEKT